MIKKAKNIKLDINEAVTTEVALSEWFYTNMRKKVTDELEAESRRYHAEMILNIIDKIGTAFHHGKITDRNSSAMAKEFDKWLAKNAKWFND